VDTRFVDPSYAAPVFLDKQATTKKAISLIREAAAAGAEIVAFPETFIPAFPVWAALWAPIDNHDLFVRMADQSMPVDGAEVKAIRDEARSLGIMVSIGISENSPASVGAIWNSNLLIAEDGQILNHHRKLVPTFYEKLIWSAGDGAGLRVVDTRLGKIGQLICGENTNPLARYALMAQGEQFHISSWPPVWPTRRPADGVNYHIAAATRIRASAHSFEAKVFGLVTAGVLDKGGPRHAGGARCHGRRRARHHAARRIVFPRSNRRADWRRPVRRRRNSLRRYRP
jgi:nitrilase